MSIHQFQQRPRPEPNSFDEWWTAYPTCRRVGKAMARQLWTDITSDHGLRTRMQNRDSGQYVEVTHKATADELLAAVRRYDARMMNSSGAYGSYKDDGKFVMHPSTWLNRGAWED